MWGIRCPARSTVVLSLSARVESDSGLARRWAVWRTYEWRATMKQDIIQDIVAGILIAQRAAMVCLPKWFRVRVVHKLKGEDGRSTSQEKQAEQLLWVVRAVLTSQARTAPQHLAGELIS